VAFQLAQQPSTGARMTQTVAPYGTWVSPVSVDLMTRAAIALAA